VPRKKKKNLALKKKNCGESKRPAFLTAVNTKEAKTEKGTSKSTKRTGRHHAHREGSVFLNKVGGLNSARGVWEKKPQAAVGRGLKGELKNWGAKREKDFQGHEREKSQTAVRRENRKRNPGGDRIYWGRNVGAVLYDPQKRKLDRPG